MKKLVSALLGALFVIVALASSAPVGAQPEPGSDQQRPADGYVQSWALAPAGSADPNQPGNRQALAYDGAPGTTIQDAVVLSNLGNVTLNFDVYATDAFNKPSGDFDLLLRSEAPTDVGTWVTFAQDKVTVAPQTEVTIPITITIPANARPGDHVGGVLASSPAPGRSPDGRTVYIDRRTGPRLFVRVGGALEPDLGVTGLGASYRPGLNPFSGDAHVRFRVENRGNVRSGGAYVVKVSGPFGVGEEVASGDVAELIPGQGQDVDVDVSGLPAGILDTARVELTSAPVDGAGAPTTTSSSVRALAVPWTLVALVVAAILLAFVISRLRHHGSPGGRGPGPGPRSGAPGPSGGSAGTARRGTPARSEPTPVLPGRR